MKNAGLRAEIACHIPVEGMAPIELHGGPWDGKVVGLRNPEAPLIQVNGPRNGQHTMWIRHYYQRRGDRYEFVRTQITSLTAISIEIPTRIFILNPDQ